MGGHYLYSVMLHRPRRRWEDNIKMYLKDVGREDVDLNHVGQDMVQ
jgi:hypothetical protein